MEWLSLIINVSIFAIFLIISIVFISFIKIEQKGYKFLFITYLIFWIPLMMTREYSGKIQNNISPDFTWLVLSSYGFVGIFVRPFADYISLKLRNRKIILYSAVILSFVLVFPFLIVQNTITTTIQSIGIGIGASMIGTYELLFKEQYTTNKSYLTVSILAIPPLLADFLSSAIQSIIASIPTTFNKMEHWPYILIWVVSSIFFLIVFIMIFFLKENRSLIGLKNKNSKQLSDSNISIFWFFLICIMGFSIAFIKFANSGSVAVTNLEYINSDKYSKVLINSLQGYISLVFSIFQLSSSFLLYFLVKKKNGKHILFTIGILSWIIYHLLLLFVNDAIAYFSISALNGFGYGILYNVILAFVLELSFSKNKISPMGIYQSILSIGITSSSFFSPFIKENLKKDFISWNYIINGTIIGIIIVIIFMYLSIEIIQNKFKIIDNESKPFNINKKIWKY